MCKKEVEYLQMLAGNGTRGPEGQSYYSKILAKILAFLTQNMYSNLCAKVIITLLFKLAANIFVKGGQKGQKY
jgi:hypothetical protein